MKIYATALIAVSTVASSGAQSLPAMEPRFSDLENGLDTKQSRTLRSLESKGGSPSSSKSAKGSKGGPPPTTSSPTSSPAPTSSPSPTTSPSRGRYLEATPKGASRNLFSRSKKEIEIMMDEFAFVDVEGKFNEKADTLTAEECERIAHYHTESPFLVSDDEEPESIGFKVRYQMLASEELIDILGVGKVQELLDIFHDAIGKQAPVSKFWVKSVKNDGNNGNFVDFHTDWDSEGYEASTMEITLSRNDDIEGGEMVFLTQDHGTVAVARAQGKAIIYNGEVPHAIAPHTGSRITLIIEMNHDDEPYTKNLLEGTTLK